MATRTGSGAATSSGVSYQNRVAGCYSDQSKAFGPRSFLLAQLGVTEKFREIGDVRTKRFKQSVANLYSFWTNWYAPVAFLRKLDDGMAVTIGNCVPVITNPLVLDRFLENWKVGGLQIPDYEVMVLRDDREFDDFALDSEERGLTLIADPLVSPDGEPNFVAGTPIMSVDQIGRPSILVNRRGSLSNRSRT